MSLEVRPMGRDDISRVFQLEKKIFPDAWTRSSFEAEIENNNTSFPCILLKDSIICGYAIIWQYADEMHIGNIAIDPEVQRQGLGDFLLSYLLDAYKNSRVVYLEVRKSNSAAIQLYKKHGFHEIYVRSAYYSDGEDALVMELLFNSK